MSKIVRSIKNVASGYSSVQVLVRNATSNDPSGPTTYDMEEIASHTYTSQTDFMEIMDMLDRRLNDKGKNWRHVAKSLTVLDYLVRFGSEKCVLWSKDNLYIIKTLREFIHIDEVDNDQGAIIRVKAKELVSLLRDDERLRQERALAADSREGGRRSRGNRSRRNTTTRPPRDEPYDADLERALEISRITAEDEKRRKAEDENDPDLAAALKLSMEEEEMRKQSNSHNQNLLDLDEPPQQQYMMATGYYQPQQQFFVQQQPQQQYDMFGNPVQNPLATGLYQQQTFQPDYQYQQQLAQQQFAQQQQQQPFPQQQPQFTGFNFGQQQQQQQQPQQPLQPLKTGNNNPFAMSSDRPQSQPQPQSLNELSEQNQQQQHQHQQPQSQPQFYTQPAQLKPQNTSSSKFNDSTHSELNNLLAQGTGIDTFGNTGANRIPHQHTQTQNFVNSSGTGYKQQSNEVRLSSNATGNPFLNVGIGYQGQPQQQQQQQQQQHQSINPAYTGYGFGNQSNEQKRNDGPSLIDI